MVSIQTPPSRKMWICSIIFRPDAVENHAIGEDPDVKVRLQDVVETSDLLIPEIEICSQHVLPHSVSLNCGSVKIDFWTLACSRGFVKVKVQNIYSRFNPPKESIWHPDL